MSEKNDNFNRLQFVDKDAEEITVTLDNQDLWMTTRDLNKKNKDGASFAIEFFEISETGKYRDNLEEGQMKRGEEVEDLIKKLENMLVQVPPKMI